jgi:hypothetical protein
MGASIFSNAAIIPAFRSVRSRGNGGTNTWSLTYPQRKKYVSYRFPIIIFCNPGVRECLLLFGAESFVLQVAIQNLKD